MKANIYESYGFLVNDWKEYIDVVGQVDEGFQQDGNKQIQLAMCLENAKQELEIAAGRIAGGHINETTDISALKTMETSVFDIITAVMPNLIAQEIVSVQPLDRRNGTVFYMKFTYGDSKGKAIAGEDMLTFDKSFSGVDYSGEKIDSDELTVTAGNVQGTQMYTPIKTGTVVISDGVKTATDDGNGKFVGSLVKVGGTNNSIDYKTGAYTLDVDTTSNSVYMTFEYDLNDPNAKVASVDMKITSQTVTARPRKLKAVYMFDGAYDLKVGYGINMDDVILKTTTAEIGFEIDNEIMTDLLTGAFLEMSWNVNPPTKGMEIKDWRSTIVEAINEASNKILGATKRYEASFIVTGNKGKTVIESLGKDYYERVKRDGVVGGPHLAGVLDNKYKVYANPNYPENAMLIGARGEIFLQSGYIYAPYIPVFATQLLVDENLQAKRGFATVYAKLMINNRMYVRLNITNIASV